MNKKQEVIEFKYGKAVVNKGNKKIAINEENKKLFTFKMPHVKDLEIIDNIKDGFIVGGNGYKGLINNKGKVLLECVFDNLVYSNESGLIEGRLENEVNLFTIVNDELNFEKGYFVESEQESENV